MKLFLIAILSSLIVGCNILSQKSNSEIESDLYKNIEINRENKPFYLSNVNDSIVIYKLRNKNLDSLSVNILKAEAEFYPKKSNQTIANTQLFYKNSTDLDFLTIPFKYRPKQKDFPNQFTTNLNGAVYLGRRTDFYKITYHKNPFSLYERKISHYAFSYGIFTGLGGSNINPSLTNENINKEYDGLVWSKGIAGIIGINNFTVGLAIGIDDLMDENNKYWIYQQKIWYGLTFGLNLN